MNELRSIKSSSVGKTKLNPGWLAFRAFVLASLLISQGCISHSNKEYQQLTHASIEEPGHFELKIPTLCQEKYGPSSKAERSKGLFYCKVSIDAPELFQIASKNGRKLSAAILRSRDKSPAIKDYEKIQADYRQRYDALPESQRCPKGMEVHLDAFVEGIYCDSKSAPSASACPIGPDGKSPLGEFKRAPANEGGEYCEVPRLCRDTSKELVMVFQKENHRGTKSVCYSCAMGNLDEQLTQEASSNATIRELAGCRNNEICVICRRQISH